MGLKYISLNQISEYLVETLVREGWTWGGAGGSLYDNILNSLIFIMIFKKCHSSFTIWKLITGDLKLNQNCLLMTHQHAFTHLRKRPSTPVKLALISVCSRLKSVWFLIIFSKLFCYKPPFYFIFFPQKTPYVFPFWSCVIFCLSSSLMVNEVFYRGKQLCKKIFMSHLSVEIFSERTEDICCLGAGGGKLCRFSLETPGVSYRMCLLQ